MPENQKRSAIAQSLDFWSVLQLALNIPTLYDVIQDSPLTALRRTVPGQSLVEPPAAPVSQTSAVRGFSLGL